MAKVKRDGISGPLVEGLMSFGISANGTLFLGVEDKYWIEMNLFEFKRMCEAFVILETGIMDGTPLVQQATIFPDGIKRK